MSTSNEVSPNVELDLPTLVREGLSLQEGRARASVRSWWGA